MITSIFDFSNPKSVRVWILTFSVFQRAVSSTQWLVGLSKSSLPTTALLPSTAACQAERDFSVHLSIQSTESSLNPRHSTVPDQSYCLVMFVG